MCFSDVSGQTRLWNIKLMSYYLHNCTYSKCLSKHANKQTNKKTYPLKKSKQASKGKSKPTKQRPPHQNTKIHLNCSFSYSPFFHGSPTTETFLFIWHYDYWIISTQLNLWIIFSFLRACYAFSLNYSQPIPTYFFTYCMFLYLNSLSVLLLSLLRKALYLLNLVILFSLYFLSNGWTYTSLNSLTLNGMLLVCSMNHSSSILPFYLDPAGK